MAEDVYTIAALNEQYREVRKGYLGASHNINCARADIDECWKAITELREQNAALVKEREADRAMIGKLQERLDRQAEFLNQMKGKKTA